MAAVEVNEYGQPISRNTTTLGLRRGALARTYVPISYKKWDVVDPKYKEDIWKTLKEEFDVPETSKENILKAGTGRWRRFKYELRNAYYDLIPTHEERILNVPPSVKSKDWIKFCENERDEKEKQSRIDHKRKREQLEYTHCTGRKTHAFVRDELEAANPDAVITPEDVWVRAHTQEVGSILPSVVSFAEKLKLSQDEIKEKQDAGIPVEEPCAMTKAFGRDSRGRVRSVGPISRTQINISSPARHKVNELKAKDGGVGMMVEEISGKVGVLIDGFVKLCHVVDEIKYALPVSVGSNVPITSRDVASHHPCGVSASPQTCSHDATSSPARNTASPASSRSPAGNTASLSSSRSPAGPLCSLLNFENKVIAIGELCTGALSDKFHGDPIPIRLAKVCIDDILMLDEITAKANKYATTFREVGIGGYVLHPKMFLSNKDSPSLTL